MRKIVRLSSLILIVFLTIGIAVPAQATPEILIGDDTGLPYELPVSLSSAPDGLFSFNIKLSVADTSVAKFTDATISSQLSSASFVVDVASDGSWIQVAAGDFGENIGPGDTDIHLATLELTAVGSGSTTVSVDTLTELLDDQGGSINANISDTGTVTVGGAETLYQGWNLFSPPGIPKNPNPATALGDDIDSLTLHYDYSPGDGYTAYPDDTIGTQLTWKKGYWVQLDTETQVDMDADVPTGGYTLEFTEQGWHMIGVPYPVDWNQVSFSDPSDFSNDSGNVRMVEWSPRDELYYNHYSNQSYVMSPWGGYWVYVESAPASLTITKSSSSPDSLSQRNPLPQSVDRDELAYPPKPPFYGNSEADSIYAIAYPNPVMEDSKVTFTIRSEAEKLRVRIMNTAGRKIYDSGYEMTDKISWGLKNFSGNRVANGIYLYNIQATGANGVIRTSKVKKLLVLR